MPPPVLISCDGLTKAFGAAPLFEGLTFTLHEGDRVGLVGPNGAGKSTLLKIMAGQLEADSGSRAIRKGAHVGYVPQDPTFETGKSVGQVLEDALPGGESLPEHERLKQIEIALGTAGFQDRTVQTDVLSGGWRKRLAVVRELVAEPDVLLLDEPTNHLDVEGILWLEKLLCRQQRAFVAVSHDRYFLQNTATRMLEVDRIYPAGLLHVEGAYADFLEKRDEVLQNQAAYQATLANLAKRELEWLRRGPKARTTKSKSRIKSAEGLMETLDQTRARTATSSVGIDFTASNRKTKRLWSAQGVSKRYGDTTIVDALDLDLVRGSRIGIVGKNGTGKTTLLRILVGELEPDAGTIQTADGLRVVYFEQARQSLDPDLTLREALAPHGDTVIYRDRPTHVASWAKRFLFNGDQLDTRVSRLSGGERARIFLARLMLEPADLLVLDEPTNDLDIPTLDVLEESLLEFSGALVLVTHDRYLLDRATNEVLALDGLGGAEVFADYEQWLAEGRTKNKPQKQSTKKPASESTKPKRKKLSYMEQREWDAMEDTVLTAESALESAKERAADPAIMADATALQTRLDELQSAQAEVDRLYERWAELEGKLH